jgi:hypothetical protein
MTFKINNKRCKLKRLLQLSAAALFVIQTASATAVNSVTDPTTVWTAVPNIFMDPNVDQQTGQTDADLVGIMGDPGFMTGWDGTNIYYRVRLGKTSQGGGGLFKGLLWIGMDANNDGALDMFIGVNNQGSTAQIGFYAPGASANTSPSTTSIQNAVAQYQMLETASNFNYQLVNGTIDPGHATPWDLDADGNTDVYLSIAIPFVGVSGTATMQGAFLGLAGMSVDLATQFRYITATSTQANSLNQDLGGINGGISSSLTYQQLGAISVPITTTGVVAPEPSTIMLFGMSGALFLAGAAIRAYRRARS